MQSEAELRSLLSRIDHRGYPAYKDTKGQYRFPGYILSIDHVQGDPFASPSKVSVRVRGRQQDSHRNYIVENVRELHFRTNCCASLEEGQRGLHSRRKVQVRAD